MTKAQAWKTFKKVNGLGSLDRSVLRMMKIAFDQAWVMCAQSIIDDLDDVSESALKIMKKIAKKSGV